MQDENTTGDEFRRIEQIQAFNIGQRYAGASLSRIAFGEGGTDVKVLDWIKKGKNFLLYFGAPGIGKTYFCSALIPWVHKKFHHYRYWNERDFLGRIREGFGKFDSYDHIQATKRLIDYDFLIIDDLGSTSVNDWRREIWFEVIDSRYESKLPTVITSNLNRDQIRDPQLGFGSRCASRMFSKENLIIEMHDGKDLRQEINSEN